MKRSKTLRAADAKVDRDKLYAPLEAVRLAKETSATKFDSTVEIAFRLGVDPRKADQMVRGTVNLPHGTGKTARVLVFATGDRAAAAEAAGADIVGDDELINEIAKGNRLNEFDAVVATPDLMGKVGRLGRVLGPRGLMPNPKTGTVTMDVAKAVTEIKGGKIEFRVDKHSNLHFIIGKVSFSDEQLVENYGAALDEILRLKPSAAKGRYLKKAALSTTMGPGIQLDPNRTRNLLVEEDPAAV
ncbi:50S ribosomal protein L1 [Streptomyces erythrochromogenes]|uniref:Large ribosomal subunit protein uL1 n=1 Tax=Streptomyces erythrochromogenes TaxID=285574 RepID=A0ABZ1QB58_9ACTN|nr:MULTISPECIES: 50S ribosomal protein L1 [Streptomyces]MCX5585083.1 50S ribosomal protein L1 [Streptomyces erythrochromogenes]THA84662.1 50S ribosomal protein L1 [Streptomyces sp. A0592]